MEYLPSDVSRALDEYIKKYGQKIYDYCLDKNNTISTNILNIMLSYVKPKNLIKFFIIHKLNFNIRFQYDAYNYSMTNNELEYVFRNFPNIVVTGLNIDTIDGDLDLEISINRLKRVKLEGKYFSCSDSFYDRCDFEAMNGLKACQNIVSFKICKSNVINLEALSKCKKLRTIILDSCTSLSNMNIPSECLRNVNIYQCYNLAYLNDIFENVRYLNIVYCVSLNNIEALKKSKNLSYLQISNCKSLIDISVLENCKKLRSLCIRCCNNIELMPNLTKCKKLQYVTIERCIKLKGYDNTKYKNCEAYEKVKKKNNRYCDG